MGIIGNFKYYLTTHNQNKTDISAKYFVEWDGCGRKDRPSVDHYKTATILLISLDKALQKFISMGVELV